MILEVRWRRETQALRTSGLESPYPLTRQTAMARFRRDVSFPFEVQSAGSIEGVLPIEEAQAEERKVLVIVTRRRAEESGLRLQVRLKAGHLLVADLNIIESRSER